MAYLCSRQKSSSQSDKPPFSLYFPLVRPLFYRFINGRPNGSSDFGYESVTRRCTFFFVSSTSSWVRSKASKQKSLRTRYAIILLFGASLSEPRIHEIQEVALYVYYIYIYIIYKYIYLYVCGVIMS